MAMGLHTSSRGRSRSTRRAPMAEINVTPLVDVMLVLLIIFMVTAPMLASGVPIELPDSNANALDQQADQVTISVDRDGARQRIALAMDGQVASEADALAARLNFLATTGAVAPFVGLFGTVWGIMNSFFQIGQQQNSSLAVVAPGISEALFATAIGLFAAIPAVIAYNRMSYRVSAYEAHLGRFADQVHAQVGRELERS